MAGGLFALLDDVAAMVKLTAASIDDIGAAAGRASTKAAGVVVDDTAVTPQFLHGAGAERELPMIRKIATGSLRNKLLFILPAALLLSQFLPWLLAPLLMCGGAFLAFEGAEKIYEKLSGHGKDSADDETEVERLTPEKEKETVSGAIRTDFILSAEIMVIALKEVATEPILNRALILIAVAILITLLVYGVVALIVKMDDVGLKLAERDSSFSKKVGTGLVKGMPKLLAIISVVGTAAMLWVGGHILLMSLEELGGFIHNSIGHVLAAPYEFVHHLEEKVHHAIHGPLGSTLAWLTNTLASALVGLVVGAIIVVIVHLVGGGHGKGGHDTGHAEPQTASGH